MGLQINRKLFCRLPIPDAPSSVGKGVELALGQRAAHGLGLALAGGVGRVAPAIHRFGETILVRSGQGGVQYLRVTVYDLGGGWRGDGAGASMSSSNRNYGSTSRRRRMKQCFYIFECCPTCVSRLLQVPGLVLLAARQLRRVTTIKPHLRRNRACCSSVRGFSPLKGHMT